MIQPKNWMLFQEGQERCPICVRAHNCLQVPERVNKPCFVWVTYSLQCGQKEHLSTGFYGLALRWVDRQSTMSPWQDGSVRTGKSLWLFSTQGDAFWIPHQRVPTTCVAWSLEFPEFSIQDFCQSCCGHHALWDYRALTVNVAESFHLALLGIGIKPLEKKVVFHGKF